MKNAVLNLVLMLASVALALLLVEFGLRQWGDVPWDKEVRAGWKYLGQSCCINELGYRGQMLQYSDEDLVVLLLGDSQVEAIACPPDLMPERALERYLKERDPRFRVFTVGSRGYGNDQEYLALNEYYGKYRADTVVLWQTFINDVWNNVFPTHWPADGPIKPTYWLEEGELKGPNYQLGEVVRAPAKTKIGVLLNRSLGLRKGLDEKWERYLPEAYMPLQSFSGAYVSDWDPADTSNKNPYLAMENLANEKTHFSVDLYPRSPRMQYGLDLTRKLLGLISDLAARNQSQLFILNAVIPEHQTAIENKAEDEIVVHKRDDLYYQTRLSQTLANMAYADESIPVVSVPIKLEDWKVSDTDSHLNCRAIDQVMGGLAEEIGAELLREKRAPPAPDL